MNVPSSVQGYCTNFARHPGGSVPLELPERNRYGQAICQLCKHGNDGRPPDNLKD